MKTFLKAEWKDLIMANYEVAPSVLEPYLPAGVELDYFEGKTYVSLVGFLFKDTRIFNVPIPIFGTFEEVNLRFYVLRKIGNEIKRGVVFINETVPSKIVALIANTLYKEHYSVVPTKHSFEIKESYKEIEYQWKVKGVWNGIKVKASTQKTDMLNGSFEEFIFEHYYGYAKLNSLESSEYRIKHPSWKINTVKTYDIKCDFLAFYGREFESLNQQEPASVFLAEGSEISVDWKRSRF